VAVALLSVLSPATLRRAVLSEDADALTLVPGIGKRTAARLILELTARFEAAAVIDIGRAGDAASGLSSEPGMGGPGDEGPHEASAADRAVQREEVRAALTSLGYGAEEVRQALARLPVEGDTEQLLRHALRELAGHS
jgi:Holliday junction DNA helicase RuvA